jgi:ABC-2 type transport system ATP-binding protein
MSTELAVQTQDLEMTYRELFRKPARALAGVSLDVERGVIFGLLGQNGAGKTTLVKALLSLIRPTRGTARVLGCDPFDSRMRRRLGYLPEQMRLPEYMKAHSFLRYMGELNGVDSATLKKRIPALLDLVGLPGEKKLLSAYSKGMQQRLGLAQALLNEPELLFLDEPTEGLDPLGRKQVRDLLVSLRAGGRTIFLNSHLLSEIELVCDRVVILNRGAVVRQGTPAEFAKHTGEYRIRVAEASEAVRAAVESVAPGAQWKDSTVYFMPQDRAQLNALIDHLRAVPVEIEAVEPVHGTLEEYFIQVVTGAGA